MVNNCKNNLKTDNRSEFPLILGRDCSGVVRETGRNVPPSSFKPGDEVSWFVIVVGRIQYLALSILSYFVFIFANQFISSSSAFSLFGVSASSFQSPRSPVLCFF